jgi:glycosyltransferase involved in cell wall biosynthesis
MGNHAEKKVIRILHVVGGMDTGGVETWLMHVLRRLDRDRYRFDFLAHTAKPCFYDEEIRSLGCRIIPCPHPSRPWQYARDFLRVLNEHGPYDVVHSHVHHFSGFTLMLAKTAGVPVRIAHSHNDTSLNESRAGIVRKFYLRSTRWLIRRCSTRGLACSGLAAVNLFGKDWEGDPRWRILNYAVDFDPFMKPVDRAHVRRELSIPLDAFVMGHVGRFAPQKNHDFLLDVFSEFYRREKSAYLLLVGDGDLRAELVEKTKRLGLTDKVIFSGVRPDIARLMLGAMDVFVFPSHHEGLGLVVVEAQAAGLPVVMSDTVPVEAIIIPPLIKTLSLQKDSSIWVQAVADCKDLRFINGKTQQCVLDSKFNVVYGVNELTRAYFQEGLA